MPEVNKGRLIGNANFTSMPTSKRKKERKSTAPDDLGTDSIPFKQWPPPHHFLARFFDAPVSVNSGSGSGSAEHEEIEDDRAEAFGGRRLEALQAVEAHRNKAQHSEHPDHNGYEVKYWGAHAHSHVA